VNQKTVIKCLSGFVLLCVLFAINQCSQSSDSIVESLRYRARADLADSLRIEAQENRDSVRVLYDRIEVELQTEKLKLDSVVVRAGQDRAEARELAAVLTEQINVSAGDSAATVVLVEQLIDAHQVEVSALESVNEALLDERAILYQRIDVADDLLSTQLELTQLAETSIASYQASANEAIQAMNQRVRRDRLIQAGLVVAAVIAVLR